jgi:nucleolin
LCAQAKATAQKESSSEEESSSSEDEEDSEDEKPAKTPKKNVMVLLFFNYDTWYIYTHYCEINWFVLLEQDTDVEMADADMKSYVKTVIHHFAFGFRFFVL